MRDPTSDLAEQHLAEKALDVVVQLERGTGTRPVLWLLVQARQRAAAAFVKFLTVDPADANAVRILQNQVNQYDDYLIDVRNLIARGREADQLIGEEDREDMEALTASSRDHEDSPTD